MKPWTYQGKPFELPVPFDPKQLHGFVYCITNLVTGKKYIGKKGFVFSKSKQIKGKKKKFKAESDWSTYCGSSEILLNEIAEHGIEDFDREILHLCKSKAECSYWETYEIFRSQALLKPNLYINEWVSCKIRRKHLGRLIEQS